MSGFWNTLKTFEISKCYAIICKCHPIFILHSLTKHSNIWCIVTRRKSWFLLLFDKHFSNCLQIPSKYSNTMLSICKVSLRKISYAKSRWRWSNCYIFSNANGIEKSDICWQKFLTSFNSIIISTCFNVWLDIMMKRWKYRMAEYF